MNEYKSDKKNFNKEEINIKNKINEEDSEYTKSAGIVNDKNLKNSKNNIFQNDNKDEKENKEKIKDNKNNEENNIKEIKEEIKEEPKKKR